MVSAILSPDIDYRQLSADQAASDEILAYRSEITDLQLQDAPMTDFTVLCHMSTRRLRPVVPKEWTRLIFNALLVLSHTGPRPTLWAIQKRFV